MIARLFRLALVTSLLAATGCISDLSLPSDPKIICASDEDCPNGLVCNVGRVCVPASYKDQPPPDLQAPPAVTPSVAKSGQEIQITLLSTQPMRGGPTVVLHTTPFMSIAGCQQNTADRLNFTCRFTPNGQENGGQGGVIPFDVQVENDLRVVSVKSFAGAVNLDFAAPTAVARIAPPIAGEGEAVLVDVMLSEPVQSAPVLTVLDSAGQPSAVTFDVTQVSETEYAFRHVVKSTDPVGSLHLFVAATDLVGNASANVELGFVALVPTQPNDTVITGIAIDTSVNAGGTGQNELMQYTFSALPGYNKVKIDFNTSGPFDDLPANLSVSVGGRVLPRDACTSYRANTEGATLPNYSCTFTVTSGMFARDGLTPLAQIAFEEEPITIWVNDAVGNRYTASAPPVIFDLLPPQVVTDSISLTTTPPDGSFVSRPTALTVGSEAALEFTVSEPLRTVPGVSTSDNVLTFAKGESTLPIYSYSTTVQQRGNDGAHNVQTTLTDLAGNSSGLVSLGVINIDTTVPANLNANTSTIVYTRAPWGRQDTAIPTTSPVFSVSGPAGSVEPSAWIRIYDGPVPSSATIVHQAEIRAGADGSFGPVELTAVDRASLYVGIEDEAGNASNVIPIKNVTWIGSLKGTISTALPTNPTLLLTSPTFSPSLDPEPFQATEVPAGQASFIASSHGVWRTGALGTLSPSGRNGAATAFDTRRGVAVLTGGDDDNGPQSDTWEWDGSTWTRRAVSSPPARSHAAAAYNARLGTTVVFGGWAGGELGDTWTYDGIRWSLWRPPSGAAVPTPRRDATLTYAPQRGTVVLFGGRTSLGAQNDLWEFDGTQWTVLQAGSAPPARSKHTLTYIASRDRFLLFGGLTGNGQDQQDTWELTPNPALNGNWSWAFVKNGATPRDQHSAYYDPATNSVFLIGGRSSTGTALDDAWKWDGSNWVNTNAVLPSGRLASALSYDPVRGEAILFGGTPTSGSSFAETWAFNGTRFIETTPASSPTARQGQAVAFDEARGVTVVFGGKNATGTVQGSTWLWNGRRWSQPTLAAQPPARAFATLAYDRSRSKLVLFGGVDGSGTALADTWEWNGSASGWTQAAPTTSPPARSFAGASFWCAKLTSGSGCDSTTAVTLLVGGVDSAGLPLRDTWKWNGLTWTPGPQIREGRSRFGMAFDASRFRAVVFGGLAGNGTAVALDTSTFEFDGTNWLVKPVSNPPVARAGHAMGYDSGRGRVVLFGGADVNSLPLVDDWSWDGTSWTQDLRFCISGLPQQGVCDASGVPVATTPSGRSFSAGAFDTARNRFVVFGGNGLNSVLNDTWELANDPTSAPAALVTFDFSAVGSSPVTLQQPWTPFATIGGLGSGLTIPGTGTPVPGARLYVWDFWVGGWVSVGSNTAPSTTPATITVASSLPLPSHIIGTDSLIHFAVVPLSSQGNGGAGTVGVKDVQLTMSYKRQ